MSFNCTKFQCMLIGRYWLGWFECTFFSCLWEYSQMMINDTVTDRSCRKVTSILKHLQVDLPRGFSIQFPLKNRRKKRFCTFFCKEKYFLTESARINNLDFDDYNNVKSAVRTGKSAHVMFYWYCLAYTWNRYVNYCITSHSFSTRKMPHTSHA